MKSPIKLFIATPKRFYTSEWLAWACRKAGGEIVGAPEDADAVLVSLQDVGDVPHLRGTRKRLDVLPNRPLLICGGLQSWTGNGVALAYADAVVVGEGSEWMQTACEQGLDEANRLPCVATKADPWRNIIPSRELDIAGSPVVQVNKCGWYALAGRGCRNKCAFCATSWSTPYRRAPDGHAERVKAALRHISGARITFITNDSEGIDLEMKTAQSMTVVDYLERADHVKAPLIRLGVEGLTEERRRWFGKPISDDQLRAAYDLAAARRQELHVFMIVGDVGDAAAVEQYASEVLPFTAEKTPALWHKWTMFQPCAFTPLWTYDCRQLTEFDHRAAFTTCVGRCRRYRDYRASSVAVAIHRAAVSRVLWEHASLLRAPRPRETGPEYCEALERMGLGYTVAPNANDRLPGSQVLMETATARDALARRMGMPELRRN